MPVSVTTIGARVENRPSSSKEREDYYSFLWNELKRLIPEAVLLRGPAHLRPVQGHGASDLDVLVPVNFSRARTFLQQQAFHRVYKPQPYLERYRRRVPETFESFTIDLYKSERWGLGFRLTSETQRPADPRTACLLHAVVDGKGTDYFEREQKGAPWKESTRETPVFGFLGRALWRSGRTGLLTLYLLLKGVIRPDMTMIVRNLFRRVAFRIWQLTQKVGVEVALLGVDGSGKSSLASALLRLPAPVKVVYMGPHDYQTWIMKRSLNWKLPNLFRQIAYRYELLVRRIQGWFYARRGWIVVYDRHPAERLDPRQRSLRNRIKDLLDSVYAWPVDLTFWLTGDYRTLYERKKEYSASYLQVIDQRFQCLLERRRIPFLKIDVTENDLESVIKMVTTCVLADYHQRISIDHSAGTLKALLA